MKQRQAKLGPALLVRVVSRIGRSIFKADRPVFALYLIHGMNTDSWDGNYWEVFTEKLISVDANPKECPTWCAPDQKAAFAALREHCPGVLQSLDFNS
eukprot:10161060-Ditylum_brightwellii.AAC.1